MASYSFTLTNNLTSAFSIIAPHGVFASDSLAAGASITGVFPSGGFPTVNIDNIKVSDFILLTALANTDGVSAYTESTGELPSVLPGQPPVQVPMGSGQITLISVGQLTQASIAVSTPNPPAQPYWTLELASYLEDAPWPATKDALIAFAISSGAPEQVVENLRTLDDDGQPYENIKEVWPGYPSSEGQM